ncbi:hypothetical protein BDF14DRAFT_1772633 [Spinellus fusiger]|nr:hypothetical protein BDF14DRAFT_1772633 [Spinellus fusiger]
MLSNIIAPIIFLTSGAFAIQCFGDNKAWDWNCKTLLDNWTLDSRLTYSALDSACLWSGFTHHGAIACKLMVNDSCTLVIAANGKFPGSRIGGDQIKTFVQNAISQCSSGNLLNAADGNAFGIKSQRLCLINNNNASSC